MLKFEERAFFTTPLFNKTVQSFLDTLLPNLVKEFCLVSAKGGTGRGFEGKLAEKISNSQDMPYHVHILNGLLPALKLLEERFVKENQLSKQDSPDIISCFILGFTFHDINKLAKAIELKDAVEQNLITLCEKLNAEAFFADWRNWIEEIKFLALGTEYRTRIYSLQKPIRHYEFFNTVLCEHCHLADAIASTDIVANVAEFYKELCRCTLDRKKLSDIWQLSYVEVQENIFTLLSQKLLFATRSIIQNERKQTVLFSLRTGFVYIGEPLNQVEIGRIKSEFQSDLSDVVASAQIDFQSCKLGFLDSLSEENNGNNKYEEQIVKALEKIIKAGYANRGSGSGNVKFLAITNYAKIIERNEKPKEISVLEQLLDEYELPIKVVPQSDSKGKTQNYFLTFEKEWDELEDDHDWLKLLALEKMKLLSSKSFPAWKRWRDSFSNSNKKLSEGQVGIDELQIGTLKELLSKFSSATVTTVISIVSAAERKNYIERRGFDFSSYVEKRFRRMAQRFATKVKTVNRKELDDFVDFYLSGNFERDIETVLNLIEQVPKKDEICLFTGRPAKGKYGAERAFGITALNFSNRSLNTLKSKDNQISSLFMVENDLRKKELPTGFYTKKLGKDEKSNLSRQNFLDSTDANSAIYYDLGEYFIDVMTQPILDVLAKAFSYDCKDAGGLTLVFDELAYDYNLYGMNFNSIADNAKSNFYFIYQMLNLIQATGFRIFTTSILTPYHSHKEAFVFENCMPFVKALEWDRIRIDEIRQRLDEMKLLLSLNPKRLVSNILNYVEDRRYLFTAFAQLDDEEKARARENLRRHIDSLDENEKEKIMSVMNNLAQIAIEMVRPKSGSASQETWIIRDALKVLKDCYKERRDKETTIEQIAGQMRKILKNRDNTNLDMCEPFAIALYEQLFAQEWNKRFPQPSRERNWIYQFAFLYNKQEDEKWQGFRRTKVLEAIKKLQATETQVTENAVLEFLFAENPKFKSFADDYRKAFREVFAEAAIQISKEDSK